jgi:hypothetical protein
MPRTGVSAFQTCEGRQQGRSTLVALMHQVLDRSHQGAGQSSRILNISDGLGVVYGSKASRDPPAELSQARSDGSTLPVAMHSQDGDSACHTRDNNTAQMRIPSSQPF